MTSKLIGNKGTKMHIQFENVFVFVCMKVFVCVLAFVCLCILYLYVMYVCVTDCKYTHIPRCTLLRACLYWGMCVFVYFVFLYLNFACLCGTHTQMHTPLYTLPIDHLYTRLPPSSSMHLTSSPDGSSHNISPRDAQKNYENVEFIRTQICESWENIIIIIGQSVGIQNWICFLPAMFLNMHLYILSFFFF